MNRPPETPAQKPARSKSAVAVAAVLAAGLVGGAVGAGGTYFATRGDNTASPTAQRNTGSGEAPVPKARAGSVQAVAQKVLPSTVSIRTTSPRGSAGGSGIVLDEQGHILTNNHVVEAAQQGAELTVRFHDDQQLKAEVVGLDPTTDLAVIKVQGAKDLKPATLGESSKLAVGQDVVAIGSPLGLEGTVTDGIVSALNRPVRPGDDSQSNTVLDAVQTDAAINPGNSGGALTDMQGRVIGINSAIYSVGSGQGGQGGSNGLGFAIPIDEAKPIIDQLIKDGKATHAQIGVQLSAPQMQQNGQSTQTTDGAQIAEVNPGSAAQKAGLQTGDVVTKVDDRGVSDADGLIAAVRSYRPGDEVTLTYTRNGDQKTTKVQLDSDAGPNN